MVLKGATFTIIHFDEIAFMNYNWIVVPAATKSMIQASVSARKAGLPSPIIYTTTAGNPDTPEGRFALNIFTNGMAFTEHLFDLHNHQELTELLKRNSFNNVLYLEFSYRQLGRTDEWFHEQAARSQGSEDDIARDLLNLWQASSSNNVIPQRIRSILRNNVRDPNWVDFSHGFAMRWYVSREYVQSETFKEMSIIGGMDTSENIGRDFTTLVIVDPSSMRVLAVCSCNDSNTMQIARYMTDLLIDFPKLVWVPERNNTGIAIIDFVMEQLQEKNINPYFRIYNEVIQNKQDEKYSKVDIYDYHNIYGHLRAFFGYRTTGGAIGGTSRNLLYKSIMMKSLELNADKIFDKTLTNEYCNLTVKNGRIDHRDGLHDDTVIGHLLCNFLVFHGHNLSFYGIDEGTVLSAIDTSVTKPIIGDSKEHQIQIRKRINELEDAIATCNNRVLKQSYERELEVVKPLVNEQIMGVQPLSVTQVKYQQNEIKSVGASGVTKANNFANRLLTAMSNIRF